MTNQAPYRINYTQGPKGQVTISVDIHGPLPDPLAGMSDNDRKAVARRSLSFTEYVTMWSVRRLPAAARQVVWLQLLSRRRQEYESKLQQAVVSPQEAQVAVANSVPSYGPGPDDPDPEPAM